MNRTYLFAGAAVAVLTALGMVFANSAEAAGDKLPESSPIPALLSAIEQHYPLPIPPHRLENAAIDTMLHGLDPHSNYYDPPTYARMNEDQEGHFSGVGLLVNKRKGEPVMIMAPVRGTPGFKAGLIAGDTIAAIDGVSTLPLDGDEVVERLRGATATPVKLTINRTGAEKPLEVTLIRSDIPKSSIVLATRQQEVGFVRVSHFGATTAADLRNQIEKLGGMKLRGLILDLRGNGGGRLSAAIDMAALFLRKGQTVLEVRGRKAGEGETHKSPADGPFLKLPLIVLIDHDSASASEVVTGALQDHDRAMVIGETSWGKGLVQTVYPLGEWHAGLALTTAKYYTPSGREIQKSFGASYDEYFLDETGAGSDTATVKTDHGREVKGGGGITPDLEIKLPSLGLLVEQIEKDRRLFRFSLKKMDMAQGAGFLATDADVAAFHAFLLQDKVKLDEVLWAKHKDYVRASITREVRLVSAYPNESAAALLAWDPVFKTAMGSLGQAESLAATGKFPPLKAAA